MKKVSFLTAATFLTLPLSINCAIAQQVPVNNPPTQAETQVAIAEVVIKGAEGQLQNEAYRAIKTRSGKTTTSEQLQADTNAILATGYFSNVRAFTEETSLGVRVVFEVQSNPVMRAVKVTGNQVLPANVINDAFSPQYGNILNFHRLQEGVKKLNKWYQDNGYVVAQVIGNPQVTQDGSVTLEVAEGVIEKIQVRYVNEDGQDTDPQGKPIKGNTQDYVVQREMQLKPGVVFNRNLAQKDFQRVGSLGIFQNLGLGLNPGEQDPRKVIVVVNVTEGKNFSFSPGGGFSSVSGFFASADFQLQNLNGRNQKLGANVEYNQRGVLFDAKFTDPWIAGDPYGTSYTVNAFRRQIQPQVFDGGDRDVDLPNGDRPRVLRTGGGITFTRPLNKNPFERSEWVASLGLQYQRVSIRDADGDIAPKDELGNNLSFSGNGTDDLVSVPLSLVRDRRNSSQQPTSGSVLRLSTEQSIPVGEGNILYNKLSGRYSFYIPTKLTSLTPGCRKSNSKTNECPQTFAFNVQAGTVLGDLPPYEAFSLGGSGSYAVRGYEEGAVGAARSFLAASAEYRFPVLSFVNGALFFDAATDLGTANSVPGNPGGAREKPGSGFGYGLGVRVQTPVAPIRLDYGWNDEGEGRLQFGIGERF